MVWLDLWMIGKANVAGRGDFAFIRKNHVQVHQHVSNRSLSSNCSESLNRPTSTKKTPVIKIQCFGDEKSYFTTGLGETSQNMIVPKADKSFLEGFTHGIVLWNIDALENREYKKFRNLKICISMKNLSKLFQDPAGSNWKEKRIRRTVRKKKSSGRRIFNAKCLFLANKVSSQQLCLSAVCWHHHFDSTFGE